MSLLDLAKPIAIDLVQIRLDFNGAGFFHHGNLEPTEADRPLNFLR